MRQQRRTGEFYCRVWFAALAILIGCATTRPATSTTTTVYLVRHGEKSTAIPNDPDPDLSTAGWARAQALARTLRSTGITAIVTTQLKRTQETAEPLAAQLGLTAEVVRTGLAAHADSVAATVMRHPGGKVLVVGHSNTITAIIAALGGPKLPNLCDSEYSTLFVVRITPSPSPIVVRQHYGAADPAPDSACVAMQSR
jgi:broad specificity phosphatase PhoE